jgi:hypothetical protein
VDELTAADEDWLRATMRELYNGHHRTVSSCHLCNIAMRLGRPLTWDPAGERFPGDAEATAMLGRQPRRGYSIEELIA